MKSKKLIASALIATLILTTAGCGGNSVASRVVKQEAAGLSQGEVASAEIKANEQTSASMYRMITGNLTIDMNDLIDLNVDEVDFVKAKMVEIDSALKGLNNGVLSDDMLNYMLWEFAKTQSKWKTKQIDIAGIDPTTRKIFVDVTYVTDNTRAKKASVPVSTVIIGNPLANSIKSARYKALIDYYSKLYNEEQNTYTATFADPFNAGAEEGVVSKEKDSDKALKKFENTYGTINALLEEQQDITFIDRLRQAIRDRSPIVGLEFVSELNKLRYDSIIESQNLSDTDKLPEASLKYAQSDSVGNYTYTGIGEETDFPDKAVMQFRFILDYDYSLSDGNSLKVTSVYLKYYMRNTDEILTVNKAADGPWAETLSKAVFDEDGKTQEPVLRPFVDRLINSFQKAQEEADYEALYNLFEISHNYDNITGEVLANNVKFASWDKYYYDQNRYAYVSYGDYNYEIQGWEIGTQSDRTLKVLIMRDKKIRGKGTYMTMPSYKEYALLTCVVNDNSIHIDHETILGTVMTSEPISQIKDVSGIAAKIANDSKSFTIANEIAVLEALQKFSQAQFDYCTGKTAIIADGILASSISKEKKEDILYTMTLNLHPRSDANGETETSVVATNDNTRAVTEKIAWLGTWESQSNVFCRVRLREYFKGNKVDYDTSAFVSLVNRNGQWLVTAYDRVADTTVKSVEMRDDKCLTHSKSDKATGEFSSKYTMPKADDSTTIAGVGESNNSETADRETYSFTLESVRTTVLSGDSNVSGNSDYSFDTSPVTDTHDTGGMDDITEPDTTGTIPEDDSSDESDANGGVTEEEPAETTAAETTAAETTAAETTTANPFGGGGNAIWGDNY